MSSSISARWVSSGQLSVDALLEELERMPAQQAAAVRVLYVADDPTSSATELANAVSVDPVLTAQVMRLANSAYYGMCGRVRSADFAVTLLGFATVRSLAASYAAGALGDGAMFPTGFWEHAAASAAGAAFVSGRVKVARPEAFSLGLLHDLGAALLCRFDSGAYADIEGQAKRLDSRQVALLERRRFGMDHAAVAGVVLESWRFPDEMIEAISTHHEHASSTTDPTPLQRVLIAGHAMAEIAEYRDDQRFEAEQRIPRLEDALRHGDIDPRTAFDLSRLVRTEALGIAASFRKAAEEHEAG